MPEISLSAADYKTILPAALLIVTGLLTVIVDLFVVDDEGNDDSASSKSHLVLIGISGCLLAIASLFLTGAPLASGGQAQSVMSGALRCDAFGGAVALIIIVTLALTTLSAGGYLGAQGQNRGEFYGLLYLGAGAMVLLAQSTNLIAIFVAIETLSLSVYVLAGFFRKWKIGSEGAMKYFVMGAFSSGFLLFGMALIYAATGTIALDGLRHADADPYMLNIGLLLVVIGFAFKVGAVPFHSWVPDAYQGAPAVAAGWMAVAVKACSFATLIRIMIAASAAKPALSHVLAALAVVTMILGNLAALNQTNMKRMLAYSGIAHTGYLLIPVVLAFQSDQSAASAALFYLAAYLLMTIGAFTALAIVSRGEGDREELESFGGLAKRQPAIALAMTVSLLSLAGIPGTAGFIGKFMIFRDAVSSSSYLYLALIGVMASLVSVYYYLRPIVAMYFRDSEGDFELVPDAWGLRLTLFLTATGTIALFVFPAPIQELARRSIQSIVG